MVERSSKPKRPRDVSQRAKMIVDIATGEVDIDEMMCHVLEKQSRTLPLRLLVEQALHDIVTVAIHGRKHLISSRVSSAGNAKVMTVEGFVDNADAVVLRKTVHQGSGYVARTGPDTYGRRHESSLHLCAFRHKLVARSRTATPI